MSLIKKNRSIDDIVAPIGKIVADLRALAEYENAAAEKTKDMIRELEQKAAVSKNDADRASKLAEKYEGLIA